MKNKMINEIVNNRKNVIVSGNIQTGKTSRIIFPMVNDIIENNENMFILDSKSEYINKYYDKLIEKDYNVVIFNLRDLEKSNSWNPFSYPYSLYINGKTDLATNLILKIGKTLFYEDTKNIDPYWSLTASDFMVGVMLGLFEDAQTEEINFNSVNEVFNCSNELFGTKDYITAYFNSKNPQSSLYVHAAPTFLAPSDTKGSILSVSREKLKCLVASEKLSKFLNTSTFNYEDINSKPTAIFFIGNEEDHAYNIIASMFLEQLYSYIELNPLKNNMNFILDNFDSIEIVNNLSSILSVGLGNKIKSIIGTRSLISLKDKYTKYIEGLCDIVEIKHTHINLLIDGENFKEDYTFIIDECDTLFENKNVKYPKLKDSDIAIFDLKKYVSDNFKKNVLMSISSKENNTTTEKKHISSIDELIKEIDKKIDDLSKETD